MSMNILFAWKEFYPAQLDMNLEHNIMSFELNL